MKSPKTSLLAIANLVCLAMGSLLLYQEKMDVTDFTIFIGCVTSVITTLIGFNTKDDEDDNSDNDSDGPGILPGSEVK